MYIFIFASKIRSRRTLAALSFIGAIASGWLSAEETVQEFSAADKLYIKEYCRGNDYDHWVYVSAEDDLTKHLIEAGFVERQPVSSPSLSATPLPEQQGRKRRKRDVIPQPYVSPHHLSDWVGESSYFWCFFENAEYYRYQPYTIKWFHNGKRFCPGGNPSISGFSLDIDPVTPETNGTYECEYRGRRSKANGEFIVYQSIKATASRVTAELGEPATVSCPISEGLPVPQIFWYRVNSPDQMNFNSSDVFLYDPERPSNPDYQYASGNDINFSVDGEYLHFDAVEEKDFGIIRCWINNDADLKVIYSELLRPGVLLVFHDPESSYTISKPLTGNNTNTGLCAIRDVDDLSDIPPEIVADPGQVKVSGLGGRLTLFGFDKNRRYSPFKGIDGGIIKNKGLIAQPLSTGSGSNNMGSENSSGFHYSDSCPGDYVPTESSPPTVEAGSGNDGSYETLNPSMNPSLDPDDETVTIPEASALPAPHHSNAISTIAKLSPLLFYTLLGFMLK